MCVGGETAKTQTGEPTVFPCQFPRHEAALDLILGLLHREQGVQPLNLHTQVFCEDSTNATYCELFFLRARIAVIPTRGHFGSRQWVRENILG